MSNRLAVVDLGTNTFHLLIVDVLKAEHSWKEIFRERVFVHLAEEGIQEIGAKAFERALKAMQGFQLKCEALKVDKAVAFGTAALRTAQNGEQFVKSAQPIFSHPIKIIDGQKEAQLIAQGVSLAVPAKSSIQLVMDIGGGSVEFILKKKDDILWVKSFPIGVAVLKKRFHHEEPISKNELQELKSYLVKTLQIVKDQLAKFDKSIDLIGASGTFDVLSIMLPTINSNATHSQLDASYFFDLYQKVVGASLEERIAIEGLPNERASLIVVAFVLIEQVLNLHSFENLYVSKYAMKEGILSQLMAEI